MTSTQDVPSQRHPIPRVSIAMPVYNASRTIHEAVSSALAQSYDDFEVVVVDNASTDDTAEIVHSFNDPRVKLYRNTTNIGAHKNADLSAQLSRGEFLKFLHADDALYPTCVERMVELMDREPGLGLVFARRRIEIGDESNADFRNFREVYTHAIRTFGGIGEVNDGRVLLRRWLEARFSENWLGEPSSVMMRREALARLGLFNARVRMLTDVEMWARTMAFYDVGFIDEELSVYRFHDDNLTVTQGLVSRWLDRLWLLEGLAASGETVASFPELEVALRRERRLMAKNFARIAVRTPEHTTKCLRDASDYGKFLVQRKLGQALPLHNPLVPPVAGK